MAKCEHQFKMIPELEGAQGSESAGAFDGLEVALTIDGMVLSEGEPDDDNACVAENSPALVEKLLNALKENNLPPTVNFLFAKRLDQKVQRRWLQSGNLLGNMTYSKVKVTGRTSQEIIDDIDQLGQQFAALGPGESASSRRYFRFPGLRMIKNPATRAEVSAWLQKNGYSVVPVTIDAWDDRFRDIYCLALDRQDSSCATIIKDRFFDLLADSTNRARAITREIAGHEVKQILSIGANQFTIDEMTRIIKRFKALGARFISVEEALRDPFYGSGGPSDADQSLAILNRIRADQLAVGGH